ncbi:MAG: molecular chaperone TorD family protein [Eggerthellaceae bacterium]|nr:molecular chaperone TorD family protein [Eggerthellaceae bacterium]
MQDEPELRRAVGLADACELLSAATAFPGEPLAAALSGGALVDDAAACLVDAGASEDEARAACARWASLGGTDAELLAADLRRVHSLLHIRQGDGVALFPYEGAFRCVREGHGDNPGLFRSPLTLDVEARMREVGALPADARTEPCDSMWTEAAFLAALLGSRAAALEAGDDEAATAWLAHAERFRDGHLMTWLAPFLDDSAHVARSLADQGDVGELAARYREGLRDWGRCAARLLAAA